MPDPLWYHNELQDQSFKDWSEAYKFYVAQRKKAGEDWLSPDAFKSWVGKAHPGGYQGGGAPASPAPTTYTPPSAFQAGPPADFNSFMADNEVAQQYANIYDQAMSQLRFEVGERRKELQKIASHAQRQIKSIAAEWIPKLEQYSKQLGVGGGNDSGRMAALQEAAKQYLGQNVSATERELSLEESSGLSQLAQEKELQSLGLYRDHLSQQGAGIDAPDVDLLKGVIAKMQGAGLSAEEVKRNAILFLQTNYGLTEEEALGMTLSAMGGEDEMGRNSSAAFKWLQVHLTEQKQNRLNQGGGFKMSRDWFYSTLADRFEQLGLGSPSQYFSREYLDNSFDSTYQQGQQEYARLHPAPAKKSESIWSRLNPFD